MAINYSTKRLRRDKEYREHVIEELRLLAKKHHIKNCAVLELGCGLGQNLELLKEDNITKGVEGLVDAVCEARSIGLDVIHADLEEKIDILDKSQDWILCLDVLEHLVNPMELMKEIRRILKDDGKTIINVPNHFTLLGRLRILFGSGMDVFNYFPEANDWDNPHLRFFTYNGFKKMLNRCGFHIIDDRSHRFSAFPKAGLLAKFRLGPLSEYFTKRYPALFVAGFFMIIGKDELNPQ